MRNNNTNQELTCLGQSVVHKYEERRSLRQMQPGTQYKNELPNWHPTWNQIPAVTNKQPSTLYIKQTPWTVISGSEICLLPLLHYRKITPREPFNNDLKIQI